MALTLSNAFKQKIGASGAEPCMMAHLVLSAADTRSFCSSPNAVAALGTSYNPSLAGVTPISVSYDPLVRSVSEGSEELTLSFIDDKTLRDIVSTYRLKGKRVVVRLGEASLTSTSYADYWAGFVEDVEPNEGYVSLVCKNATMFLSDTRYQKRSGWFRVHPFRIMNEACRTAGLSSLYVNSTSFNPDNYSATISHFAVSRYIHEEKQDDRRVIEPESVADTLAELSMLTQALVITRENGKLDVKEYAPTSAATATLTFDDIVTYNQGSTFDPTINALKVAFGWRGTNPAGPAITEAHPNIGLQGSYSPDYRYIFQFDDTDSKARYSYASAPSSREYARALTTKWIGAACNARQAVSSTATAFSAVGVGVLMFSGHRKEPWQTNYSKQSITPSRLLYLMIPQDTASTSEVISVSTVTFSTTTEYTPRVAVNQIVMDTSDGPTDVLGGGVVDYPTNADGAANAPSGTAIFRVKQRGAFGSPKRAISKHSKIIDVTPMIHMSQTIVARYADGAPTIGIRTGLDKHDIQIGDIVQLGTAASPVDLYLEFGSNGAGVNEVKLECIGKDINPLGDDPGINFTFVRARTPVVANPLTLGRRINRRDVTDRLYGGIRTIGKSPMFSSQVEHGFQYTTASGLYATIGSGAIYSGLYRSEQLNTQKILLHTSADNYIDFDPSLPGFVVTKLAVAATVSNRPDFFTPIARLRTNATTVSTTGYLDLRDLQGLSGAKINQQSVGPASFGTYNLSDNMVRNAEFESFVNFGGSTSLGPPDFFSVYTGLNASATWNSKVKAVTSAQSGTIAISLVSTPSTYGGAIASDRFPISTSTAYAVGAFAYPTDSTVVVDAGLILYSTLTSARFSTISPGVFTSSATRINKWNSFAGFANTNQVHVNTRFASIYVTTSGGTKSTFIDAVFVRRAKPHLQKKGSLNVGIAGTASSIVGFSTTGGTNTHAFAWNGSTAYTFPESGTYRIDCNVNYRNSTAVATRVDLVLSNSGGIDKTVLGKSEHTLSSVDWSVGGSFTTHILIANRTKAAVRIRKNAGIIIRPQPADPGFGGLAMSGTYLNIVKLHD